MGVDKRLEQMGSLPLNPTWFQQVHVLLQRNFREQKRKWKITAVCLLQTIIMAVLIGTVFLRIGQTQSSIVRRESVIFFCIINQGIFGALTVINSFPVERTLTLRERASGTYFASSYFVAKIIADTLVQIPIPIAFVSQSIFDFFFIQISIIYSHVSSIFLSDWMPQLKSFSCSLYSHYFAPCRQPR